jgi:hypothetical protein
MSQVRARRIENEWRLLQEMARSNPGVVRILGRENALDGEVFRLALDSTGGLIGVAPDLRVAESHVVRFRYPEYFPAAPLEAFLETPVYHPNVHPEQGFVCLWTEASRGDTICEAIPKLRQVISWELMNPQADHVMQPEALVRRPEVPLPLACAPLLLPAGYRAERAYRGAPAGPRRRRLSGA